MNNRIFHTFNTTGFAQVGTDNFDLKDRFQTVEMMRLVKSMKPPKHVYFRIQRNPYEVPKKDAKGNVFFSIISYQTINVYVKTGYVEKQVIDFINRVEAIDTDKIEKDLENGFKLLTDLLENGDMLPKDLGLTLEEATMVNGYTNSIDMLQAAMNDFISPSLCPLGCDTEPDGKCSHGFESVLMSAGIY